MDLHGTRRAPASLLTLLALGAGLSLALAPSSAEACGGTFCDNGPQVMPVDQTGETIVFWTDRSGPDVFTEAHIQIQYEGDAERFAWIVPVQQVPEIRVGSQALFDNMLQATVPSFTRTTTTYGECASGIGFGCAKDDGGVFDGVNLAGEGATGGDGGDPESPEGPDILDRGFAGAFEYVTLTGDDIQEIVDWLEENGYAQDPDAPPILQEYLDDGFVFVAIKLQSGAGVEEIHPLTVRYPGEEPCIPIKLTRIAAVDDMAIRAMFLGQSRVASSNWPHVEINHSRLDWANSPAQSYPGLVGAAIDEAGGRAWTTEYAGVDDIVSTTRVYDARWDAAAFAEIEPLAVVDELSAQGLANCAGPGCSFAHPQVEFLLEAYLPAPAGMSNEEFWSCLECYVEDIDMVAWQAQPGFAAEFDERIVSPGSHAVDMLEDANTLTRLYTLLSPHEMLEDPVFHETTGLGTVDNSITATRFNHCGGGVSYFELPDGRQIALTDSGSMPALEGNPAAERIERIPMMGPPQVEVDNGDTIDALLDAWNEGRVEGPEPGCAVQRIRIESVLCLLGIFGIAWTQRRPRSRP